MQSCEISMGKGALVSWGQRFPRWQLLLDGGPNWVSLWWNSMIIWSNYKQKACFNVKILVM